MNRKVGLVFAAALIALSMATVSCKPITYYLGMVYKAHGTVTEKTEDGTPGVPLTSVEVIATGYEQRSLYSELTNVDGKWEMELAEGTWTLEFVKEGYETVSVGDITVDADNPRQEVDVELVPITPGSPGPGALVGVWFGADLPYVGDPAYADMRQTYGPDGFYENLCSEPGTLNYYQGSGKGTYSTTDGTLHTQITDLLSNYDPETGEIFWEPAPFVIEGEAPYVVQGDTLTITVDLSGWGGAADTVWTLTRQQ